MVKVVTGSEKDSGTDSGVWLEVTGADASGKLHRDRTALWIVDAASNTETKLSFAELSRRSNQTANFLRDLGLKRGDHLLMLLGNVVQGVPIGADRDPLEMPILTMDSAS